MLELKDTLLSRIRTPELRVKAGAQRAARILGDAKLDMLRGAGQPGFLVEDQIRRFDVHDVLAAAVVRWDGGRVRTCSGRSLKIDLHLAIGANDLIGRVIVEVVPVNPVRLRPIRVIHRDAHVVQLGMSAVLVLHHLCGMHGEAGVAALGLRERIPVRRLLNRNTQFAR